MAEEPTRNSVQETSREIRAREAVMEVLDAENKRIDARIEELWRKRRALDAINPIGGFTEERWREIDAEREALRRRIEAARQLSDNEAASA
jgi:chromosome segregation ATPase